MQEENGLAAAHEPTVFVVDDDDAAAASLTALVMSIGLRVNAYNSAEEFLAAYDGQRGCLVLDMRLKGMNGIELQETLVAKGVELPIVVISGHADRELREKVLHNGAIACLQKPFHGEEFCEAVRTALAQI